MKRHTKYLIQQALDHLEIKNAVFDNEDEHLVRETLNEIENEINSNKDYDDFVAFQIYPNIPIIQRFLEKWNVDALVFDKWVIIDEDGTQEFINDVDIYNDDFSFVRLNDKTYDYYKKLYPEETIEVKNYQYPEWIHTSIDLDDKSEKIQACLSGASIESLIEELKKRVTKEAGVKALEMIARDCESIYRKAERMRIPSEDVV